LLPPLLPSIIVPPSINCAAVYCATAVHLTPPPIRRCPIAPLVGVLVGWQEWRGEKMVVTAVVGVLAVGDK